MTYHRARLDDARIELERLRGHERIGKEDSPQETVLAPLMRDVLDVAGIGRH